MQQDYDDRLFVEIEALIEKDDSIVNAQLANVLDISKLLVEASAQNERLVQEILGKPLVCPCCGQPLE